MRAAEAKGGGRKRPTAARLEDLDGCRPDPSSRASKQRTRQPKAKKVLDFAAPHSGVRPGWLQPTLVDTASARSVLNAQPPRRWAIKVLKPSTHYNAVEASPARLENNRRPLIQRMQKKRTFEFPERRNRVFGSHLLGLPMPTRHHCKNETRSAARASVNPTTHPRGSKRQRLDAKPGAIMRNIGFPTPSSGTARPVSAC